MLLYLQLPTILINFKMDVIYSFASNYVLDRLISEITSHNFLST